MIPRCQSTLNRPSEPESRPQCRPCYSDFFGPCRNALRSPIERQQSIVAFIAILLFPCRPSHVARLVVAIVFNALKCVLRRRPRSHVGVEVLKRQPPIADCDSATSVVIVGRVSCGAAACKNMAPHSVLRGISHAVCHAGRHSNRILSSHDDAPNIRVVRMAGRFAPSGHSYFTGTL
jgi:hypothetical protein